MPSLLVEIGCEELPASACREAGEQLPVLAERLFGKTPDRVYVSPRRLAILIEGLPEREADEERRGPAERIAFDEGGKPTKAAEGFARGLGLTVEELERRDDHVWGRVAGQSLAESLPERVPELVRAIGFGKSMRWSGTFRFARPVRWLCVKLDENSVPVELEGVPVGETTFGHRFSGDVVQVPTAGAYADALRAADVEPDATERHRLILEGLDAIGGWSDPGGVLGEVVHLVERPVVLEGSFGERFLALPRRVVETAMQSHQRYFPLGGARFAFVANGGDPEIVRAGNEQVLGGRLEDASFTFERDVRRGIEELARQLPQITLVAGAGTYADKTERLVRLVEELGGGEAPREAARLAKADQAAELVREFPDLQGHIGAEYARLAGFPEAVASAIDEHYLPDAAGGALPGTESGRLLSAADKLDNLVVAFSLGQRPTGSRDPFGLRRAAIGLARLAVEASVRLELPVLVALVERLLLDQGAELADDRDAAAVVEYVSERLEGMLDLPVEFVRAARASSVDELGGVARLAGALSELDGEALEQLHTAYTRADRLAGKSEEAAPAVDLGLLTEPAERDVAAALERVEAPISSRLAAQEYAEALEAAAELGPPLDRFFEDVLIMAEDRAVRANRLRLLLEVRDTLGQLGDFGQLQL